MCQNIGSKERQKVIIYLHFSSACQIVKFTSTICRHDPIYCPLCESPILGYENYSITILKIIFPIQAEL